MSENITHTAITDDCARLVAYSETIRDPFKAAFADHHQIARLGGVTRSGDRFTVKLLRGFRDRWPDRGPDEPLPQKLAFVLGWLCHRAADRQMKPVFRTLDPDCELSPTDCSVYHDVFLFREVYASGALEPYTEDTLAPTLGVDELEDLLRSIWQRALISIHTFIPDADDVEGWLERLFETRQRIRVDLRRYAEALADPDPDKVRRFIDEPNFYDPDDRLIHLARQLQAGEHAPLPDLPAAVETAKSGSEYAQGLRKAYLYLQAASHYFDGETDESTLTEKLEIGKPEG